MNTSRAQHRRLGRYSSNNSVGGYHTDRSGVARSARGRTKLDLIMKNGRKYEDKRDDELSESINTSRYQNLLVQEEIRQTKNSIKRHGFWVPEVNIDLVSGHEKRILVPHASAIEHRRAFHEFHTSKNQVDKDSHKTKLAEAPSSYRTREGYKKVNQSTSNIQMSSTLSNFSAAQGLNQRRERKANAVQYQKNVLDGRQHSQAREDAKFNDTKWTYSTNGLWNNLAGAQKDPNNDNKGITGFTYEPSATHRSKKLQDMSSQIHF